MSNYFVVHWLTDYVTTLCGFNLHFLANIPTSYPQTSLFFVLMCFGTHIFKNTSHSMRRDLIFRFQFASNSRGLPRNSGYLERYWADPARHIDWVEAGLLQIGLLALFLWKETPTVLILAVKTWSFMCQDPPHTVHSTILIIMMLNEDLSTGLIYKHTKEMGCSSASQYEFSYWFAGDEPHYWCSIILRKEFLRALLVTSQ